MKRLLTDEQVTHVRERHASGASYGMIARTLKVSINTIRCIIRGTTYTVPAAEAGEFLTRKRKLTDEQVREAARLYNSGKTYLEIGKLLGVPKHLIGSIIRGDSYHTVERDMTEPRRFRGGGVRRLAHKTRPHFERIMDMRSRGKSYAVIAKATGLSPGTVSHVCSKHFQQWKMEHTDDGSIQGARAQGQAVGRGEARSGGTGTGGGHQEEGNPGGVGAGKEGPTPGGE